MRDDGGFVWEATMSEQKDDGGAAFPNPYYSNVDGMSLRDWFAGMALSACVDWVINEGKIPPDGPAARVADLAYYTADAMLEARKK